MDDCKQETQMVVLEIMVAASAVLKRDFGFTPEMLDEFLDATIVTANATRVKIISETLRDAVSKI